MVSFNSLQTGKWIASYTTFYPKSQIKMCFNSLQTGTRIARETFRKSSSWQIICFHSLQTGNRIQSIIALALLTAISGSFHSLQTGTRIARTYWKECANDHVLGQFPFPSNGNAHRKESGHVRTIVPALLLFPFPSNGNAHRKFQPTIHGTSMKCFHSLQTGTRIASAAPWGAPNLMNEFPFPSNGKGHRKGMPARHFNPIALWFPFPSNGNAYCKSAMNR